MLAELKRGPVEGVSLAGEFYPDQDRLATRALVRRNLPEDVLVRDVSSYPLLEHVLESISIGTSGGKRIDFWGRSIMLWRTDE